MKRGILILAACCLLGADSKPGTAAKDDKAALQGKWKMVACQYDGKKSKLSDEELQSVKLLIKEDQFIVEFPKGDLFGSGTPTRRERKFVLDGSKRPKSIDLIMTKKDGHSRKMLGIYSLENSRFQICFCEDGRTRPTEFATKPKSKCVLTVYEEDRRRRESN